MSGVEAESPIVKVGFGPLPLVSQKVWVVNLASAATSIPLLR